MVCGGLAMENLVYLSATERLYGLSLIWKEANYNFAFFDRVPDLDWDSAYREYIPQVISAEDPFTYYELLSRFTALLKDGHTAVIPPKWLYLSLDRPKIMLMNVEDVPIVTNASSTIGSRVPVGSHLLEIDGIDAREYLYTRVVPAVSETTPHRLLDHATARLLLGLQGSKVNCRFYTPDDNTIEMELLRNRRIDPTPWLRTPRVPDPWEFVYFDEWFFNEAPFSSFEFRTLEGNVAYVALNTFMDPTVAASFTEKLSTIRQCSGLILDLRKNHGGSDGIGYSIVAHFLRQPTETILARSPKHIASYRVSGLALKDTPADKIPDLPEGTREQILCYRNQWYHEEQWGSIQPSQEILSLPTVLLTDSETGSAAEDFIMAFESGKGEATRIGRGTAGSTGQPLIQELPGGGGFAVCTIRMPWPEAVWQKGIEPHIHVEPTIEDVIRNRDRTLETAVGYLCGHEAKKH
jgi:carboxyl-terminal processing protease